MRLRPEVPCPLAAGLVLAVVLDTGIQLCWKYAVVALPAGAGPLASMMGLAPSPWFLLAMAALAAQFVNWLSVLSRADLSFAQPITSLSFVTVVGISRFVFHEALSPGKLGGIGLILLGVFFVSRTPVRAAES